MVDLVHVQVLVWTRASVSLQYVPRSEIAGSFGKVLCSF